MLGNRRMSIDKVRLVVGAETETGSKDGLRCQIGEYFGLNDAVFVVTTLWPRIGKEDENVRQHGADRERVEKFASLCFEEEKVFEFSAVAFAAGASDPVFEEVDTDAERLRVRRCVCREKMPMAAADLKRERDAGFGLKCIGQIRFQAGEARVASGEIVGGAGRIFHRAELAEGAAVAEAQRVLRGVLFDPVVQPFARTGRPK